jgi:dTDP-4-dehydrorhamnose 3,5-epimerase
MDVTSLEIPDVKLIKLKKHLDGRGYFVETYNRREHARYGINQEFVQDNQSLSHKIGTIRGLHFQIPPMAQAKLVGVLAGSIFDVAVDIRRGSPTYGKWCGAVLRENTDQIFIPQGFAHGFCTLEPDTLVAYKVDSYYAPDCNRGIRWNDPTIGIKWPPEAAQAILSDNDAKLPLLADFVSPYLL